MKDDQEKEVIDEKQETTAEETTKEIKTKTNKNNKKGNYISGTIGAILGGFVASIPWILTYIFANMIIAVLATIIAGGAYLGYKIFRGKIGKAFPAIITIVSLLVVTVVTTVICPIILMAQSGFPITLDNLIGLYSDVQAEVRIAILEDLAISLLFTIIGIGALAKTMSIQAKNNMEKVEVSPKPLKEKTINKIREQSEVVNKACTTLNCKIKETATTKQKILNELETTYNLKRKQAKKYLNTCLSYKILKKYKGKYYYDENVTNPKKKLISLKSLMITILIILLIAGIGLVTQNILSKMERKITLPNTDIVLRIDGSQQKLYDTPEKIAEEYGAELAQYFDVIIEGTGEKSYLLYGQILSKTQFKKYDIDEIMKANRDYDASYYSEEMTSKVEDKKLGDKNLKHYNFKYKDSEEKVYTGVRYLYEGTEKLLWIESYKIDAQNGGIEEIETVIEKLLN